MLTVPLSLNRNAKGVRDAGEPADTGAALIRYMCRRIGLDDLAGLDVLDFGCGARFSESFLNRNLPVGSYTGVEVEREVIEFLRENVTDPRMRYIHADIRNAMYNPDGIPLGELEIPELAGRTFDVACMFSVITHTNPSEAVPIFELLRRHIRETGHLFFSAFQHDTDDVEYLELNPKKPGHKSSYSRPHLTRLLAQTGWSVRSVAGPHPEKGLGIMTSFLCRPT